MSFTVRVAGPAARVIRRLDQQTRSRILALLRELAVDPFNPAHSRLLAGGHGLRRARVSGWRALFRVDPTTSVVDVEAIRPRGQAYGRRMHG